MKNEMFEMITLRTQSWAVFLPLSVTGHHGHLTTSVSQPVKVDITTSTADTYTLQHTYIHYTYWHNTYLYNIYLYSYNNLLQASVP